MNPAPEIDLAACRHWRASLPFGGARLGLVPAWNAVTLLNPAAAEIWDLAAATGDVDAVVDGYARARPARAELARADVDACLVAWGAQGLFHPPAPSPEQKALAERPGRPVPNPSALALRHRMELTPGGPAVVLEIAEPTLARIVADLVAGFPEPPPGTATRQLTATGPDGGWLLRLDGAPLRRAETRVAARGQIVAELVRLAAGGDGWRATVHGAALTGQAGTVFLTGETGAGKSTLAAGLVSCGWALLAEDIAAFDDDLRVTPMPFALSVKEGAVPVLREAYPALDQAPVHRLGPRRVRYLPLPAAARAAGPARPGLIVQVRYDPGLDPDQAETARLSPLEALGLFLNDESFIDFERDRLDAFLRFVEHTPAHAIRYGSLAAAQRAIAACLAGAPESRRG